MPLANPLVEGMTAAASPIPSAAPEVGGGGPVPSGAGTLAGMTSDEFTSTHVGVLVGVSLVVLILLHIGGFRFAVDAGVTRI